MKQIAVVILNWNGAKMLQQFLPSVIKYTNSNLAEIIVVDNGSTDDSVKMLEKNFSEINFEVDDTNFFVKINWQPVLDFIKYYLTWIILKN